MAHFLKNYSDISSKSLIVDLFLLDEDFSMCCFKDNEYLKLIHQQHIEMNELKMKHKDQKRDLVKQYLDDKYFEYSVVFNS